MNTLDCNNRLFRLSCEACKRGMAANALLPSATKAISSIDFDVPKTSSIVKSAYAHVTENPEKKAFPTL